MDGNCGGAFRLIGPVGIDLSLRTEKMPGQQGK